MIPLLIADNIHHSIHSQMQTSLTYKVKTVRMGEGKICRKLFYPHMAWNLLRVLYMWLATVCQIKEKKKKVGEFKEEMDFTEVKWSDDK